MIKVNVKIGLYLYSELEGEAKEKAFNEHEDFLNSVSEISHPDDVEDSINANEYLFFENGELANCTTYTGKHEKAGITEFKFLGKIYEVKKQ